MMFSPSALAQIYPDQHYVLRIDSLVQCIEANDGLTLSADGKSLMLQQNRIDGYIIVRPQYSHYPFNEGLPSWNGSAPGNSSSFKVQMRFPYGAGWSPWLTVGFWRANIWSSYGSTTYAGGMIDYDTALLNSYVGGWQFKVIMTRTALGQPSPTLHKLSFLASDSRSTASFDVTQAVNDKPAALFIPTDFIYQYGVDPVIGGSICSPTSVSMILRSYGIPVDPYNFALATRDPYFNIFGIWPRVVQNASEYGLDGAVTRCRSWSQARDVLAGGGRISMSVGLPLYSGHLIMLAGFTANGDPIVHDPAKSNGYSYVFSKSDLSRSWFEKGGVGYTFYPVESELMSVRQLAEAGDFPEGYRLFQNYPNPFNPATMIRYQVPGAGRRSPGSGGGSSGIGSQGQAVSVKVYDMLGHEVRVLVEERQAPGKYEVRFDGANLPTGVYVCRMMAGDHVESRSMLLLR